MLWLRDLHKLWYLVLYEERKPLHDLTEPDSFLIRSRRSFFRILFFNYVCLLLIAGSQGNPSVNPFVCFANLLMAVCSDIISVTSSFILKF